MVVALVKLACCQVSTIIVGTYEVFAGTATRMVNIFLFISTVLIWGTSKYADCISDRRGRFRRVTGTIATQLACELLAFAWCLIRTGIPLSASGGQGSVTGTLLGLFQYGFNYLICLPCPVGTLARALKAIGFTAMIRTNIY